MKNSHAQLKITAAEWEAFLDDLQQSLDKFGVPATEQAELKAGHRRQYARRHRLSASRNRCTKS